MSAFSLPDDYDNIPDDDDIQREWVLAVSDWDPDTIDWAAPSRRGDGPTAEDIWRMGYRDGFDAAIEEIRRGQVGGEE